MNDMGIEMFGRRVFAAIVINVNIYAALRRFSACTLAYART